METPDSQQSYSNAGDYLHLRRPLPTGYPLHKRYRITGVLSEGGGFGMTYRAVDTYRNLNLDVVVKENFPLGVAVRNPDTMELLPLPGMVDFYAKTLQRFAEEAELLSSLNHPNIVRVSAHFSELNTAYYVMPYIGGTELHRALPEPDKLNEATLLPVLRCLLETLHYMHGHNLMHRDIKPNNILMDAKGTLKLIDFGLVRSTEAAHTLTRHYTPGYAPVEQISGKGKSGPWTDIYSLGATCYTLITGAPPPDSVDRLEDDEFEPLQSLRHLHGRYSSTLLAGIDRALSVKRRDRWQSAREWLVNLPTDSKNGTPGGVPSEPPRRSRSNVTLILLILVLALVIPGGYVLYQHAQEIGAQRLLAQQEAEQKAREEAERKAREEAERKAREEAERKAREEAERKVREEAERNVKEEEEAERKAGEEAERKAREEAERKAKEEAERKAREEAERKAREEAERKAKEEAERKAREEAKRLLSRKGISESEYSSRIISAAEKGDNEQLSLLITAGADVNKADKDGWTPLHWAAWNGNSECVKRLLATPGIDVNMANEYGWTPLDRAASNGHSKCVKLLLAAPGINVNKADKYGKTPLYGAACWGHSECVKLLLAAPGINVNMADEDGRTSLYGAAFNGHSECVKLLLAAPGIDVNMADKYGWTPLYGAARWGHSECVKLLLAAPGINVNMADKYGKTPLANAAALGHSECARLIRAAGGRK
ncbi:MAG: ankyrin repeat domain-containing protein [Akkermansia sp.]|nr:ankyrin repeat domain-containing protein [Akkermansia sp.]